MPPPLRRLVPFALTAIAFGAAGAAPPGLSVQPEIATAAVFRLPPRHFPRPVAPKPTLGEHAAAIALEAVGVPYRWGGASPSSGFDCSGLVYWAYGRLGIDVPHSSYALYDLGRPVPRSGLEAGDLLFFSGLGHVGLYLGRGRMIHAPHSGRDVEVVSLGGSHYGERLVGARRIVPQSPTGQVARTRVYSLGQSL
jgi:cell wall-associated NlpC family hydrolase